MTVFFRPNDTRVEQYINLVRGEGANAAKRVDALKHIADHDIIYERGCRIMSYAQGSDCDSTGTVAGHMDLLVLNSITGTLGDSAGIVNADDVVYVCDVGLEYIWRVVATVDDNITIDNNDIIYPSAGTVADYTALVLADLDIIVVGREHGLRLGEDEIAWSTLAGGVNAQSVPMEDDCSVDTGWWEDGDNLETDALTNLATAIDVLVDPATMLVRNDIITYDNLATNALQTVRPTMVVPFHLRFPIPYQVGVGFRSVYYPPQWGAGATPPSVSNRVTGTLRGGRYAWQCEMNNNESAILYLAHSAATATLVEGDTVRLYLLMRTTAAHTNVNMTVTISDGVGSTATTILGTGAGGLSASYTWFTADHIVNASPTYLRAEIANLTGGGVVGIYMAQADMQQVDLGARPHILSRPHLERQEIQMAMSGTIAAGYWTFETVASNTIVPVIFGEPVAIGIDVHAATAPTVAGYDQHTIYIEGGETDAAAMLFNTYTADVAATPTTALTINGGTEPGFRAWVRCRATATGAGVNGMLTLWAYTIRG